MFGIFLYDTKPLSTDFIQLTQLKDNESGKLAFYFNITCWGAVVSEILVNKILKVSLAHTTDFQDSLENIALWFSLFS